MQDVSLCMLYKLKITLELMSFSNTPQVNKKQDTILLPITSPNNNRFSQFFR